MLIVYSEIGRLKKVLLHRPGQEIENLIPEYLERLLFDDIPYLKIAQEEHDAFAQTLRDAGTEVCYLDQLVTEALESVAGLREQFIQHFLAETHLRSRRQKQAVTEYLLAMDTNTMVRKMMAGIRKNEVPNFRSYSLGDYIDEDYPFATDPLPNLYFTRDPFSTIGNGVSMNHMYSVTRNRETLFSDYIFRYHPMYNKDVPYFYERDAATSIEGGDILVLNDSTLAIGVSQRTDSASIEAIARKLIYESDTTFEKILAFDIPKSRAFMHLDTVFTQIDHDKFTIHPGIMGPLSVYELTKGTKEGQHLKITQQHTTVEDILSKTLDREVELVLCGGGDKIIAGREQWNDGTNTLAIAPGEVVVYSRNYITNEILQDKGIKTHIIPSSELSRGRGGARCMSMPLEREKMNW